MIIVDIGACVGSFIDDCIEQYGLESIEKIYAFEPLEINYNFLVEKYKENEKIQIFDFAISNQAGQTCLFVKNFGQYLGNSGSSLKPDKKNVLYMLDDSKPFTKLTYEKVEANSRVTPDKDRPDHGTFICENVKARIHLVQAIKMSDFIQKAKIDKIDLLKIDAEGSEYDIFEDLLETRAIQNIEKIYFEDHKRSVPSLTQKRELVIERIKNFDPPIQERMWVQCGDKDYELPFSEWLGKIEKEEMY